MKYLTLIPLLFSLFSLQGQDYFEGNILFKLTYYDSVGNKISPESIGRDSEMSYFISGGNYKSLNENGILMQLYNSSDNKYYFTNQGQVQAIDASFKYPQQGLVTKLNGKEDILGHTCSKLSIESENDVTVYYFTANIMVNIEPYKNHDFGHWKLMLESTGGALALKYEIKSPNMKVIMEAVEIHEMSLNEDDFNIQKYLNE